MSRYSRSIGITAKAHPDGPYLATFVADRVEIEIDPTLGEYVALYNDEHFVGIVYLELAEPDLALSQLIEVARAKEKT